MSASKKYVRKVPHVREKAVDEGLGLVMISIWIQQEIIEKLKALAHESGLGYQPYIRQILAQHIQQLKKKKVSYR